MWFGRRWRALALAERRGAGPTWRGSYRYIYAAWIILGQAVIGVGPGLWAVEGLTVWPSKGLTPSEGLTAETAERLTPAVPRGRTAGTSDGLTVGLVGVYLYSPAKQALFGAGAIGGSDRGHRESPAGSSQKTHQEEMQDLVEWDPTGGGTARVRLVGQILDYTGQTLLLRLPDGREQKIPGPRVLRVQTRRGPVHQEAERRFMEGRLAEALALYRKAIQEEPRRWVRREILARMVVCYEEMGQSAAAGETFLLLVQSDPSTPYWEVIPLAWVPMVADGLLERQARQWLVQDPEQSPVAVLLGASHLLAGSERASALERLNRLVRHSEQRIALLALAQTWRTIVQPNPAQVDSWEQVIQKLPPGLRAGPYYVLGRAYAQQGRWQEAALAWLRVPILYGRPRYLAARALVEAAGALERLEQKEQAARLYQEVLQKWPDTPFTAEAQQRLEELAKPPSLPKP